MDAINGWKRPASLAYLGPIQNGHAVVVWDDHSVGNGTDNRAVSHLIPALVRLGHKLERNGCATSAADCRWLASEFKRGKLTVIDRCHL